MSKNLTRKGLALGAIVALGSSVIAGTPALAANELTVAPSAGTSYNTLFGQVFDLATTFAPGYAPASYAQLKYQIKTDANSAIAYKVGVAASAKAAIDTEVATPSSPAQGAAVAVSTTAVTGATTGATAVTVNHLSLYPTAGTAIATSVEVTSFVDANNDGALTAGEWNTVRTVNFKTADTIVPVVSLTQPRTGDAATTATVAWGDLNVEQIAGEEVKFNVGSGYVAATSYTASTGVYSYTTAVTSSTTVAAQAYIGATALGTAASLTATARTISDTVGLVSNVVAGNDAIATAATTMVTNTAARVRTNGSFTAQVKAFDRATTPAAAPGVAVVATVATSATLSATAGSVVSITINGVTYTDATALAAASFPVTTDASGLASVVVSTAGYVATKTVTVTFKAQNLTSAVVATAENAVYTVTDDNAGVINATNKNTAVTFNVTVKDQFGALSARTNERLKVVAAHGTPTVGVSIANQFVNVVAGKASFTVTPTTDNVTDITVTPTLEISSYDASTGVTSWGTGVTGGADLAPRTVTFRSAAYSFTTAPAVTYVWGTASAAYVAGTADKQKVTASALADLAAVPGAGAANATWARLALTGSNIGEKLTVSGEGVFLSIDGAAASAGSATKVAQATTVAIYVASNTVGTKTLTITNGSVSSTVSLVFFGADAAAGTKLVLDVPATEIPGRTVTVTAKLTDKFGNPVESAAGKIAITASGAGYFVGTNATATDADGLAKATFVNQSADAGTVVFTAKWTGAAAAADYLTTTATTVFAQPVVVDPSASVATVTVSAATTSQAGRALDVTVKAVDAAGKAVEGAVVALSSTGAGSLSATSVVTNAAGVATVKLVAGSADLGSSVVTATSNAKSASATVEFGATDASVDLIGKRVYVTTEFAAGKRVTIYDNGVRRYSAIQTSDAEKVVMWNVKAGSHTIVVKISGSSSDSVTFLVK